MGENPKAAMGRQKVRYCFTPPIFRAAVALVMELGARKYGPFNWRKDPVRATDYVDAIQRHLDAWTDGEDLDPESKVSHLAHIAACCAVLMDAEANKTMIDDRFKGHVISDFYARVAGKAR